MAVERDCFTVVYTHRSEPEIIPGPVQEQGCDVPTRVHNGTETGELVIIQRHANEFICYWLFDGIHRELEGRHDSFFPLVHRVASVLSP